MRRARRRFFRVQGRRALSLWRRWAQARAARRAANEEIRLSVLRSRAQRVLAAWRWQTAQGAASRAHCRGVEVM